MGRRARQQDPQTPEEWQEAADLAESFQLPEAARQYGLVTCGSDVDQARSVELLAQGKRRGITPRNAPAEWFADSY